MGVFVKPAEFDGVVTVGATFAVTTVQGGFVTLTTEGLTGGIRGMVSVGGTCLPSTPSLIASTSGPTWELAC